jgi:hypothetical protein
MPFKSSRVVLVVLSLLFLLAATESNANHLRFAVGSSMLVSN